MFSMFVPYYCEITECKQLVFRIFEGLFSKIQKENPAISITGDSIKNNNRNLKQPVNLRVDRGNDFTQIFLIFRKTVVVYINDQQFSVVVG